MSNNIIVSIIVPIYNGERFVASLFNLFENSLPDRWEVLIVDNNSKDKTLDLIKYHISLLGNANIRYIFCKQQGVTYARMCGVRESKGEYLYFLDADDSVPVNAFKKIIEIFDIYKNRFDIIYGNFIEERVGYDIELKYGEVGISDGKRLYDWICKNQCGYMTGKFIKKSIFLCQKLIPYNMKIYEDLIQMIQISYFAKEVMNIGENIYKYNLIEGSACNSKKDRDNFVKIYIQLSKSLFDLINLNFIDSDHIAQINRLFLYYTRTSILANGGWSGISTKIKKEYFGCLRLKNISKSNCSISDMLKYYIIGVLPQLFSSQYINMLRNNNLII